MKLRFSRTKSHEFIPSFQKGKSYDTVVVQIAVNISSYRDSFAVTW